MFSDSDYYFKLYLFSTPTSAQCHNVPSVFVFPYGQIKISDSEYFFLGIDQAPSDLHLLKVTFGNSLVDWSNKIA